MSDTATLPVVRPKEKVKEPKYRAYNVVLLNDDDHSFEYVIRMLKELFAHSEQRGFLMALEVHERGRCIVCTTSLERAELKRDQIHAFGPDPLIPRCQGSMSAEIELVED
jgi:ATP-dependent Clp protease adaptor protein ClpS